MTPRLGAAPGYTNGSANLREAIPGLEQEPIHRCRPPAHNPRGFLGPLGARQGAEHDVADALADELGGSIGMAQLNGVRLWMSFFDLLKTELACAPSPWSRKRKVTFTFMSPRTKNRRRAAA